MTAEPDHARQALPAPVSSTFSEAEYTANLGKVIAHAAATGTAVIVDSAGLPILVITTSAVDSPHLDG